MDLRSELNYDAAPDDVFTMLCDEAFRTAVCKATGSTSYDVAVSRDGDGAQVRVRRVLPAQVPDFAKKFVGDHIEVVQTERWGGPGPDGGRSADLKVEIPGKPGSVTGSVTLSPSAGGSRELITGDIKVSIPLVGRKLEGEVHRGITAAIKVEQRVGTKWLAGDR
ncbi:MAG: DUF2505 domain-containing protein [Nocardioidaceae bacterium]